jgi:hypothetical protein
MAQEVFGEAANRGKPAIASHDAVATLGLDVLKKCEHGLGANVVQLEICNGTAGVVRQKQEKELECVPVSTDGVLTCADDPAKVIFEEALHQR